MVKVSFNSALGQKSVIKDSETLIPVDKDPEDGGVLVHQRSKTWCWGMCLGVAFLLTGILIGWVCLYRFLLQQHAVPGKGIAQHSGREADYDEYADGYQEGRVFESRMGYREQDFMIQDGEEAPPLPSQISQIQESIRVLEDEEVELINVPVPEFNDSDPADIVHDFVRQLTAYLDLNLNKCYVIPLNTSIVIPPKDAMELLVNIKAGTYLPQSYLVHEQMMVTERLDSVDQLGNFIYSLCRGKDTYKLQRRDTILGFQKREALT